MKKIILAIAAVAIVGLGAYAAVTTKQANDSNVAEQNFIEQMIPHHASAIAMGNLAKDKAQTEPIKTLASNIIAAQQKEITEMRGWYTNWYGKDVPETVVAKHGGGHNGAGMTGDSLATLQSAQDFDLEFVRQMIPHHESAIVMARDILLQAKHQEIKNLANAIISSQQAEIDQMQSLVKTFEQFPPGSIGRNKVNQHCDSPGSC